MWVLKYQALHSIKEKRQSARLLFQETAFVTHIWPIVTGSQEKHSSTEIDSSVCEQFIWNGFSQKAVPLFIICSSGASMGASVKEIINKNDWPSCSPSGCARLNAQSVSWTHHATDATWSKWVALITQGGLIRNQSCPGILKMIMDWPKDTYFGI